MACGGMFYKKSQLKIQFYFFLNLSFSCYYCSIELKRRSEHSGFRPDTSSLVRNCFKMVQESLYDIIDLLTGAKFITFYLIWRVEGCFTKNLN